MARMSIQLTVNGRACRVEAEADTPLLYVLRNEIGLKGTRFGCGLGQCGACTVIVDGKAVQSCDVPVSAVAGRRVETIEALDAGGALHPLQQAFVDEQAAQCGYCASGIIMAAKALLDREPHPSDEEVRAALEGNLCRCGTHSRILRAIRRVAGAGAEARP
jgi:aerobic-type carbon monoxide dehydrogenase small subunit (CoxS/CutS family)